MAKRQSKNKNWKHSAANLFLVVISFALYLMALWFAITHAYQSQPLQKNLFTVGQVYKGENYVKSLDLRVAAYAAYPSASLKVTRDLGRLGDLPEKVINFSVKTDNLSEYGLMVTPSSPQPAAGYPVLILCHGYFDPDKYHTDDGYLDDMKFYADHGFVVIKPDFRGQGLSINQGQPESAYYSMAYNTDLMSLISAVKQTNYLNKDDINLWGHSMGAYIALRSAILSPEIKNVVLLGAPVGKPIDMYQDYVAPSDKFNPVAAQIKQTALLKYGTPITNPNFWNSAAPIDNLGMLKANVEINVGANDKTVPPLFSAQLNDALDKAKLKHEYYVYIKGDHSLTDERTQIWQRSLELLTQSADGKGLGIPAE